MNILTVTITKNQYDHYQSLMKLEDKHRDIVIKSKREIRRLQKENEELKMSINKLKRKEVYNKCEGRCAYCGTKIDFEDFQVDHIIPKRMWMFTTHINDFDVDGIDNLLPSCSVCNHYKRALDLEMFRHRWLGELHIRIKTIPKKPRTERGRKRKEYMQRILDRYDITEDKPFDKKFYFEKQKCK